MSPPSRPAPRQPVQRHRDGARRVAALATLALTLTACGLQQDLSSNGDLTGGSPSMAPDISAATLGGARFALSAARGHPVVVDFWGSWCDPCRAEQPSLNRLYATYASRGVRFIGVDMRDDDASARAYQAAQDVPYASVVDTDEAIAGAYNVAAPPMVFVIDVRGRIVLTRLGSLSGVASVLDRLL